jgi:hypothetical protein
VLVQRFLEGAHKIDRSANKPKINEHIFLRFATGTQHKAREEAETNFIDKKKTEKMLNLLVFVYVCIIYTAKTHVRTPSKMLTNTSNAPLLPIGFLVISR